MSRSLPARIREAGFLRAIVLLAAGVAASRAVMVLVAPLLTRLYQPEAMGQLATFVAFLNTAAVLATLRFDFAIVSAGTDRESAYLALGSVLLSIPVGLAAAGVLYLWTSRSILGFGILPGFSAGLVVPALLVTVMFSVLRYHCVREAKFAVISRVTLLQSVARAVVQLGIGTVHGSWLGLMAGELAGRASGIGRLRRECLSQLRDQLSPFTIGELARTLAVYRKFPLVSLPSSLLDVMALSVAVPLVSELYGADAAGQFALVQLVCAVPVALVGVAVADAFHSRIALFARQAPGRARALFLKTAAGLFAAGVGPLAVLALAGPVLFRIAFGQQWSVAGELASVMAPWALAQLVVSPVSQVAFVFRAQEFKLIYDVLNLTTVTAVLLVGQRSLSLVPVVSLLSWVQVVNYSIYFGILWWIVVRGTAAASATDPRAGVDPAGGD